MPTDLDDIGADLHSDLNGRPCTFHREGAAAIPTTVRCQGSRGTDAAAPTRRSARTGATMYLLRSAVAAQPAKGEKIVLAEGDLWDGDWVLTAQAEPTHSGEWRCLVQRDVARHTIASAAGSPRPPTLGAP